MPIFRGAVLVALVVLNSIVLLGQFWPEGAPAFARIVIVGFLVLSLAYFLLALMRPAAAR